MLPLPEEAFRRYDETPDEEFYQTSPTIISFSNRCFASKAVAL